MNQPYLFCLCVLCNVCFMQSFFIDLILSSYWPGAVWGTQSLDVRCKFLKHILKTVTIEGKVSPVLTNQSSAFVGLARWVNFTQVRKVYSELYDGRCFWNQAHLRRLMPKYLQALTLVSLTWFTRFVRALKTCEKRWILRVLFQALESPWNCLLFILVL